MQRKNPKMRELFNDYLISPKGRVINKNTFNEVKSFKAKNGYLVVQLKDYSNKWKTYLLHRLVAEAYLEKPIVNHIDGDKSNPKADNLEWTTKSKNAHSYHNLISPYRDQLAKVILNLSKHFSGNKIASLTGLSTSKIKRLLKRERSKKNKTLPRKS